MTESEWLSEEYRPQLMVASLGEITKATRTKVGRRKLRLFACGCCRLVWPQLTDPRCRDAVEVAERFAEGRATKEQLEAARSDISGLWEGSFEESAPGVQERTAAAMAAATTETRPGDAAIWMTALPLALAGYEAGGRNGDAILCDLLRCVFGNPFRPVAAARSWLAWNAGAVAHLARSIYDERAFDRLPILADALEDAGCTQEALLAHCRSDSEHDRGCWVVDLLTGKA